jgi:hypothetical protein
LGDTNDSKNGSDYFARIVELVGGSVGEDVYLGQTLGLKGSDRRKATDAPRHFASRRMQSRT